MSKQAFLVVGIVVIIVIVVAIYFSGFGLGSFFASDDREDILAEQLQEQKEQIAKLDRENRKYNIQIRHLTAENQRLNASRPNGGAVEEIRKALVEREAALQHKENQLNQREDKIRLAEEKIDRQQQEFYQNTNLTMEEIGEAKQIKKEYEYMRVARERAEERANKWLIGIALILAIPALGVIVGGVWMARRNRRTDEALDTIKLNTEQNNLLISSFGERFGQSGRRNSGDSVRQ